MTAMERHTSQLKAKETSTSEMMLNALLVAGLSSTLVCGVPVIAHTAIKKEHSGNTHHYVVITEKSALLPKHPKVTTERGRKMLELRNKAVAKGMKLLAQDELLSEIHEARGELG
jgi:hypothetical protein